MAENTSSDPACLPETVRRVLDDFVAASRVAFADSLESAVLFGSAAEGRLRPSSDVNLILVLKEFRAEQADELRQPLRVAHAAIRLEVMFLLSREIEHFAESFGVKFSDIVRTRLILWGSDPFTGWRVDRETLMRRISQVLFNLRLRLRAQYVSRSLRHEQLVDAVAEAAGPLRSTAAAILELEGISFESKKEALARLAALAGVNADSLLKSMSEAREDREISGEDAGRVLLALIDLCEKLEEHVKNNSAR